jgi:hypothetical protein
MGTKTFDQLVLAYMYICIFHIYKLMILIDNMYICIFHIYKLMILIDI